MAISILSALVVCNVRHTHYIRLRRGRVADFGYFGRRCTISAIADLWCSPRTSAAPDVGVLGFCRCLFVLFFFFWV